MGNRFVEEDADALVEACTDPVTRHWLGDLPDPYTREVALEYRLLKRGPKWKVDDVVIDGVSFVSTYRSQFDRIIKASSYQALVDRMRGPHAGVPALVERP